MTALDSAFIEVDQAAADFVAAGGAPGLAYGVVQHGVVLHSGGAGTSVPAARCPTATAFSGSRR